MKRLSDNLRIAIYFLVWRISLFIVAWLAPFYIKTFGNKFPYRELLLLYKLPDWITSFANFDGVHYIWIAKDGYSAQYTQAFFPLYSIIIRFLTFHGNY